jgi:hypothetical protein
MPTPDIPEKTQRKMKFSMTLQMPFESFDAAKWAAISEKLGVVAGCSSDEIKFLSVHRGCTIIRFEMLEGYGRKLLEAVGKFYKDPKNPGNLQELTSLATEYHVTQLYELSPRLTEVILSTVAKPQVVGKSLLFVHGWRGDTGSFGKLPEFLAEMFECKASIYSYPTGIFSPSPSIIFVADALRNYIATHLEKTAIAVVCHSMGGWL